MEKGNFDNAIERNKKDKNNLQHAKKRTPSMSFYMFAVFLIYYLAIIETM